MPEQQLCPVSLEALVACLARAYAASLRLDEGVLTTPMNNRQRALLDDLNRQLERAAANRRSLVLEAPGPRKLTAEDCFAAMALQPQGVIDSDIGKITAFPPRYPTRKNGGGDVA